MGYADLVEMTVSAVLAVALATWIIRAARTLDLPGLRDDPSDDEPDELEDVERRRRGDGT